MSLYQESNVDLSVKGIVHKETHDCISHTQSSKFMFNLYTGVQSQAAAHLHTRVACWCVSQNLSKTQLNTGKCHTLSWNNSKIY